MVFLGIILAAAAVGAGIGIVAESSAPATLSVFGQHVPGVSSQGQVFISGVLVTVLFGVGMLIAILSLGRSMRVRRELRDLRDEHEESLTTLERENQQLQRELARARGGRSSVTAPDAPVADRPGRPPVAPRPATPRPNDPVSPFFDQNV